jgi:dihydrofolate synthase/folylpolyglutamate synthase
MMATKDATGFFRPFAGQARKVFTIAIPDEQAGVPADELSAVAHRAGLDAEPRGSLVEALAAAGQTASGPRVLICGSLYLAGAVLKANG